MKIKKVIGARTSQSNNEFTDMQKYIDHTVEVMLENGETIEINVSAECPRDAINRIEGTIK